MFVGPVTVGGVDREDFSVSNASGIALDPATPIVQLWLESMLTDSINYWIGLDSVELNGGDTNFTQCTLATSGLGTSAQFTASACGDSTLIEALQGNKILLLTVPRPNPATDQVTIGFLNGVGIIHFEMLDALGKTRIAGSTNAVNLTLDLSSLPSGVYFFRATSANGISASTQLGIVR